MKTPAATLVLLPGMDGGGELFAAFIAALGDAVPTLVVSYPPDQVLDYAGVTAFARARLPQDRPFVLLGESFSGPVAIALAAEQPPGLIGLILCCSFARNPVPAASALRHLLGLVPMAASLPPAMAPFLLGSRSTPALRSALRTAVGMTAPAVMRARLRAVLEVDYSARVAAIKVPMLYLQARQDRVVSARAAAHLSVLCPTMQVVRIDGPRLLLQAAAEEAASKIRRFLNACS